MNKVSEEARLELSTAIGDFVGQYAGVSLSASVCDQIAEAIFKSPALSPHDEGVVIDLDKLAWESLVKAAGESSWMPPDYFVNDWVSDCADFLRNGHPKLDEGVIAEVKEALARADEAKKGWEAGVRIDGDDSFCLLRWGTYKPIEDAARRLLTLLEGGGQ